MTYPVFMLSQRFELFLIRPAKGRIVQSYFHPKKNDAFVTLEIAAATSHLLIVSPNSIKLDPMNQILRNVLAVVVAIVIGSAANFGLIMVGVRVIPPPEGFDLTDPQSIKSSFHLLQPQHFIFPFLAHALGTLVGAFTVAKIAASQKLLYAVGIGVFFLFMGLSVAIDLPAPLWFEALDLIGAYLPMALLGAHLAGAIPSARKD